MKKPPKALDAMIDKVLAYRPLDKARAAELAELIAGFAKVRLCKDPSGLLYLEDHVLAERDRFLIVACLRRAASVKDGDAKSVR